VRALIVDEGLDRHSVTAARALHACGWTVGSASATPNIASRSRATSAWHRIVHTDAGDQAFVESLERVVSEHRYDAVFVSWERGIVELSARREQLPFRLGYGPHEGLLAAVDKWRLTRLATDAGLGVPATMRVRPGEIAELSGPIVIKPSSQIGQSVQAAVFESRDEALRHARRLESLGLEPIAQERLEGELIAVTLVAGPDGIVSIAQQVAELTWPQPVGITARGRSVAIDPVLRGGIERLLAALEWQGLTQLKFVVPGDGRPRLIDFNPRFYGSLPLAIRAGANHPDTWGRLITGQPVTPSEGRPGAVYQWLSRDLRASLSAPDRIRETIRCVSIAPRAAHTLWSPQEPLLAPRFLLDQSVRGASRRIGRTGQRPGADAHASARLHGAPATAAMLQAVRTRPVPLAPERLRQRIEMKRGRLDYERDWLAPLQAARRDALGAAADAPPRFLVRVDEFPYSSGYDDPRFGYEASLRFHEVMAGEGVRYLIAVVPQWTHDPLNPAADGGRPLDDRDRELLARMRADGVSFAQHGRTHRTRHSSPRRRSELGGLDDAALEALLDRGMRELAEVGVVPRILVPPFNRFDARQWPALSSRYDVITGGPESVVTFGFHGGPQWRGDAVYLPCYAPLYEPARVALGAVEALLDQQLGTWIPVVLHTSWEVEDDFASLRAFARRIAPYAASWDEFLQAVDESRPA
jgi:predicted ATP-grasp superfamily ATP-dependent carboligase